jgi:hypothetical protein
VFVCKEETGLRSRDELVSASSADAPADSRPPRTATRSERASVEEDQEMEMQAGQRHEEVLGEEDDNDGHRNEEVLGGEDDNDEVNSARGEEKLWRNL